MIRWARNADRDAVLEVMKAAEAGSRSYSFADMDGHCLLDEVDGTIRGVALFSLARPYTVIRELAIAPGHRKGTVLANLSAAIYAAAKQHGSQGVEGFKSDDDPAWIEFSRQRGASIHRGARVQWLLTAPAVERLLRRRGRSQQRRTE